MKISRQMAKLCRKLKWLGFFVGHGVLYKAHCGDIFAIAQPSCTLCQEIVLSKRYGQKQMCKILENRIPYLLLEQLNESA